MKGLQSVKYSKAQLKIQQMAFVLVATMIFFAIVAMFYVSIRFASLQESVEDIRKDEVIETVQKISGSPEFLWSDWEDCSSCVDLDKLIALKNRTTYKNFWEGISLLQVIRVSPRYETEECTTSSYPRCNQITLIKDQGFESYESFVSLCRFDSSIDANKCELGKIVMGFEGVDDV